MANHTKVVRLLKEKGVRREGDGEVEADLVTGAVVKDTLTGEFLGVFFVFLGVFFVFLGVFFVFFGVFFVFLGVFFVFLGVFFVFLGVFFVFLGVFFVFFGVFFVFLGVFFVFFGDNLSFFVFLVVYWRFLDTSFASSTRVVCSDWLFAHLYQIVEFLFLFFINSFVDCSLEKLFHNGTPNHYIQTQFGPV